MSTNTPDIKISDIEGFEQVSAIIADQPLFRFSRVRSFCYFSRREDELGDQWRDIDLVMEKSDPPYAQIGIRFHRVVDVSFSGFGQIMGLYFQKIEERGWERFRFEVGDYEEDQIHLFCHGISVYDPNKAG